MVFGKYLKLHVLVFTILCCRLPLCRVDTPIFYIFIPLFCFMFWITYWWFGLIFWFNLYDKLFNRSIWLFYFHVEVWKVTMYSTIPWRPIRYNNLFTSPLQYCVVIITVNHEFTFPQWTIYHLRIITPIFLGVHWFVSTFIWHGV